MLPVPLALMPLMSYDRLADLSTTLRPSQICALELLKWRESQGSFSWLQSQLTLEIVFFMTMGKGERKPLQLILGSLSKCSVCIITAMFVMHHKMSLVLSVPILSAYYYSKVCDTPQNAIQKLHIIRIIGYIDYSNATSVHVAFYFYTISKVYNEPWSSLSSYKIVNSWSWIVRSSPVQPFASWSSWTVGSNSSYIQYCNLRWGNNQCLAWLSE